MQPDQPTPLPEDALTPTIPAPPVVPGRRMLWPWVAAGVAVLLFVVAATIAVVLAVVDDSPDRGSSGSPVADGGAGEVVATTTPVSVRTPGLDDIHLTPRIMGRQCFGSAGCNVNLRIDVAADFALDPAVTWEVTYEVTGPEDGPLVDTLTITGDEVSGPERVVSTPRSSTRLRVRVTAVSRVGW